MALKQTQPARGAQWVLAATYAFAFDDVLKATDGVNYSMGADTVSDIITNAKSFEVVNLPVNAMVLSGQLITTTAFVGGTLTVKLGDSVTDNRYLAAVDIAAAGVKTVLQPGYVNIGGLNIVMNAVASAALTAGAALLVVNYVISGRVNEVVTA